MSQLISQGKRLSTWKEIANWLGVSVRTAQEYEKKEGLPVERMPGRRSRVAADPAALEFWVTSRSVVVPPVKVAEKRPQKTILLVIAFSLACEIFLLRLIIFRGDPKVIETIQLTHSSNAKYSPVITDGQRLYFTETRNGEYYIATVPTNGGEVSYLDIPIARPYLCDISPDHSSLLIRSVSGAFDDCATMWIVPLRGGQRAPQKLSVTGFDGSWSPDQRELAISHGHDLYLLDLASGKVRTVATTAGIFWWPRWSRDRHLLRCTIMDSVTQANSLWELDPGGGSLMRVSLGDLTETGNCCGNWTADGRHYFFDRTEKVQHSIWVRNEQPGWLPSTARKPPVRLTEGVLSFRGPATAPDSQTVFARAQLIRGEAVKVLPHANSFQTLFPGGEVSPETLSVSPDGRQVVYASLPEDSLWITNEDGTHRRRLLPATIRAAMPSWSADGKYITVMLRRPDQPWRIAVISPQDGRTEEITHESVNESDPTWSADQRSIVFGRIPTLTERGAIRLCRVDVSTHTISAIPDSEGLFNAVWSPDGRLLAALNAETFHLFLFRVATGGWSELTNIPAGFPVWSRDSRNILFIDPGSRDLSVSSVDAQTGSVRRVIYLKAFRQPATAFGRWIGLAADGSVLAVRDLSSQEIFALSLNSPR